MTHGFEIVDKDPFFEINAVTRAISNASSAEITIVQFDHNSERFTFRLNKYVEGHDMTECNKIEVHYKITDGTTLAETLGVYEVTDLRIDPDDETKVICTWLISQNATQKVGKLDFLIRFACVENDGTIKYAWNTKKYSNVYVTEGIYNGDYIAEKYADIIAQWKQELIDAGANALALDKTLLVEGEAADARATGDAIRAVGERIDEVLDERQYDYVINIVGIDKSDNIFIMDKTYADILSAINSKKTVAVANYKGFTDCWLIRYSVESDCIKFYGTVGKEVITLIIYAKQGSYGEHGRLEKYEIFSNADIQHKADKATTLSGYGIEDAYNKDEIDTKLKNLEISGVDLSNYYDKDEVETRLTEECSEKIGMNELYNMANVIDSKISEECSKKADKIVFDFDETYVITDEEAGVNSYYRKVDKEGNPIYLSEMQVDFTIPAGEPAGKPSYLYFYYRDMTDPSGVTMFRVSAFNFKHATKVNRFRVICYELRDGCYAVLGYNWQLDNKYTAMQTTLGHTMMCGYFYDNPGLLMGIKIDLSDGTFDAGTKIRIRGKRANES